MQKEHLRKTGREGSRVKEVKKGEREGWIARGEKK